MIRLHSYMARQSHSYHKRYAHTAIWHDKAIATINDTLAQLGAQQSPSFIDPLAHCVYAMAWQTLATISPFMHSVCSTKTQLSLNKPCSLDLYAAKLPAPTSTKMLLQTLLHSTTQLISASSNDHPTAPMTRTYQLPTSPI